MNAVEIEQAVSELIEEKEFDAADFPFEFLIAFGNKATTLKKLRKEGKGTSNKSDVEVSGDITQAVLQRSNIHLATCEEGAVAKTLTALRESTATSKQKAKYILATDGVWVEAEMLNSSEGETLACDFDKLPDHFAFFLELAGISTVREIRENAFDIKATGRLNRLYIELLKHNPGWEGEERRKQLNHFFARLIFCFFAEDTGIFMGHPNGGTLFTRTLELISDDSNVHEVLDELFRAMDIPHKQREAAGVKRWAMEFPYVNGGLFSRAPALEAPALRAESVELRRAQEPGAGTVPHFSKVARSYLLHIGNLDWTKINPDIFGSMIQAVADEDERSSLGMHYTSVPNILKLLTPLFLDELREQLEAAGDSKRKLLNLRKRLVRIRVFDPACGSGNFLVIAYKEMRGIEAEINTRRGEAKRKSEIPLTNFRGIELRHFAVEIARLALIIAEYQTDVLYRGSAEAMAEFLPLEAENWITHGNALRLDWAVVCPPSGASALRAGSELSEEDEETEIRFDNEGGEVYVCGNPPYVGDKLQNKSQKEDLKAIMSLVSDRWRSYDYICGFFFKAKQYIRQYEGVSAAFVTTNSICQGVQASEFWPHVLESETIRILFANTSFKWRNLASNVAGVTVAIVALARPTLRRATLIVGNDRRIVECISPYLTAGRPVYVSASNKPLNGMPSMTLGNAPKDGGNLIYSFLEYNNSTEETKPSLYQYIGARELTQGIIRYCLWFESKESATQITNHDVKHRLNAVRKLRQSSSKKATASWSNRPWSFVEIRTPSAVESIVIPIHTSENREYFPIGRIGSKSIASNATYIMPTQQLSQLSLIASKLHIVWIGTVCGKLKTDYRYSNTLGWNTFPVPTLTTQNKADLTRCAEDILLTREAHWPATIAELYNPDKMPADLRAAHDRNDETLERIYIGRRFRNDTERLEKLFGMYEDMVGA